MMMQCDKHLIEELQKNGYEIDFKRLKEIYQDSRNHPEVIKKRKKKMLKAGKYYEWNNNALEWEEISREEYSRKAEERIKKK